MLNPINAIRGLVGLLAGEHGAQVPAGEQAEILDRLRSSALRLLRLGEDLRDLRSDRLAEPRLAPVDLVQLVREMVEVHRHRRTPHELTLQAPDTLPLLLDAGQVQRVMENLLENAIRYSPGGGTVTVRVTEEGEAVRVTVRDQGLGIAPEDLGRIFTRYFRATNAREKTRGTGIGLFSVKRLVEAHGGQVGVESAPGQGSMFWFRLPRRPASSQGPPSTWPPGQ
jgi:signal transduction histidine kinase